jgi:tetratricopeptide (TPR) repeat protein
MNLNKSFFVIIFMVGFTAGCINQPSPTFATSVAALNEPTLDPAAFPLPNNIVPVGSPDPNQDLDPAWLLTPTASPPSINDYIQFGEQQIYRGNPEHAIQVFEAVLSIDPTNFEALHGRGLANEVLQQYEAAIRDYTLAIESNRFFATAYNARGEVYFLTGKVDLALLDFSKAIELDPLNGRAYQNRALVQQDLGHPEAAMVDLQVYLALSPDPEDIEVIEELVDELAYEMLPFIADREGRIYADDFSTPANGGWYGNGDGLGLAYFNQQGYRIAVPIGDTAVWANNSVWVNDARIEVDAKLIGGSEDNLFGILCRFEDNGNFYVLVVSSDGYYGIGRRVNGGPLEPAAEGQGQLKLTDRIKTGEEINHISASCIGSKISLSVNGHKLIEVDDIGISAGASGLFVATYDPQGTDIMFDNFEVYEP